MTVDQEKLQDDVGVATRDVPAQRSFYAGTLGLPVLEESAPTRLTVRGTREAHYRMPPLPYDITVARGLLDEGGGGYGGGAG